MTERTNSSVKTISIGEVFRDTYGDADPSNVARVGINKRTIRVIGIEPDGRYLADILTALDGTPPPSPRKTRVSEKTLRAGYVPVTDDK